MKIIALSVAMIALVVSPSIATVQTPPTTGYYSITYDTVKGTSTMQVAGQICMSVSSRTLSTCKVLIDGTSGFITVSGGSITASSFFGDASHVTGLTESQITNLVSDLANKVDLTETSSVTLQNPAFSVGNSTLVVSNGQVAIGTTSLGGILHVNSNGVSSSGIILRSGASDKFINYDLGRISRDLAIGVAALSGDWSNGSVPGDTIIRAEGHNLLFSSGTVTAVYISTSLNVGIGTTTPGSRLDVNGDSTMRGSITGTSTVTVQGNAFSVGGSTLVVTSGMVGIGQTNPGVPLSVVGPRSFPATSGSIQSGTLRVIGDSLGAALDFGNVSGGGAWLQATNATDLSLNYKLLLNPNGGNVGIGTTTPALPLDVNGAAQFGSGPTKSTFTALGGIFIASGSSLTLSGAGGYVTSVSSVNASAFFGDGSHLSGIPSTAALAAQFATKASSGTNADLSTLMGAGTSITVSTSMTVSSTMTILGNAFSVGGSSFTVGGGSATVAYQLSAGSFVGNGAGLTGVTATNIAAANVTAGTLIPGVLLNAGSLTNGPVASSILPSTVAYTSAANAFTAAQSLPTVSSTMTILGNAFSVGGSTFVVTQGNVGIGTVNPGNALVVKGPSGVTAAIVAVSSDIVNGTERYIAVYPETGRIETGSNGGSPVAPLRLGTADATRMTITTNGNVGIGTTSPGTTLDVNGSIQVQANVLPTSGTGAVLTYYPTGKSAYLFSRNWSTGADQAFEVAASTFIVGTDNGTALTVLNNRNVGIGYAAPGSKLTISDGPIAVSGGNPVAGPTAKIGFIPSGRPDLAPNAYMSGNTEGANWYSGTALSFYTHPGPDATSGSPSERMRIDRNGNVGIGTVSPDTTLHVAGTVKITGGSPGTGKVLTSDSVGLASWSSAGAVTLPTRQVFTSGSGTYTTPANVRQISVRMVGGGGGGGSNVTNDGVDGSSSTFNSIDAAGGKKGIKPGGTYVGGIGGTGGAGTASIRIAGGGGGSATADNATGSAITSGAGGSSAFGGGGAGGGYQHAGFAGATNSGGGGSGAATTSSGSGGGAGEYVEIVINSPSASYSYAVGAGGAGGAPGSYAGGAGGSGIIIVDEIY